MKCIFWHRRDFRLHDNCGLTKALSVASTLYPVVVKDQILYGQLATDDPKILHFEKIYAQLSLNYEQFDLRLSILTGNLVEELVTFAKSHSIEIIFANESYEPAEIQQELLLAEALKSLNIQLVLAKDHVYFAKNEIVKKDLTPYVVFTPYKKMWLHQFQENEIPYFDSIKLLSNKSKPPFETNTTSLLSKINNQKITNYSTDRDIPSLDATMRISVELRYGTISIRESIRLLGLKNPKLLDAFIWRDFYQMILFHFPHAAWNSFRPIYDQIVWENDEEKFQTWCEGKTGFPIVDAGMRELNETGFMHNRVRMIVASFLCKDLQIDWRWGASYFAAKLLDYDLASNSGGWQWAAGCGCDAAPYFRIFNPDLQQHKFDKDQQYIQKWIPEYLTKDYPSPIVNHAVMKDKTISMYKKGLNKGNSF